MNRSLVCALVSIGLAAGTGCSISASSESISKSISSPFKWSSASSKSSSPDEDEAEDTNEVEQHEAKAAYSDDVRQLSMTYTTSGGEIGALRTQVSKLAIARGITNWEIDALTCTSLAEGARAGGMTVDQQIAFSNEVCSAAQ